MPTAGTADIRISSLDNLPARARVSRENTREQPDHRSTTRANHNTGLSHALDGRGTLTSFARPPHDLPHTFPRQLALAARWRVCLSRPLPSKSTQIENDLWSWYHSRSTVQYLVAVHSMSDGSLHTSLVESVTGGISASDG